MILAVLAILAGLSFGLVLLLADFCRPTSARLLQEIENYLGEHDNDRNHDA
jgi:hypothetical protein